MMTKRPPGAQANAKTGSYSRSVIPSRQNLKLLLIGLSRDLLKATTCYVSLPKSGLQGFSDSLFTASLWMNTTGHFLLSTMQGPMAANAAVNVWSQYLRRIASYGCMVFGICNPRVVYETVAAKIPEDDWLKL